MSKIGRNEPCPCVAEDKRDKAALQERLEDLDNNKNFNCTGNKVQLVERM